MPLYYKNYLRSYSRQLRAEMTLCEHLLWSKIRRKQILGVQFYRQRPIGPYIVDFYANYPKIAIELDGGQHYDPLEIKSDLDRDQYLASLGIRVIRFSNLDIAQNCQSVMEVIADNIRELRTEVDLQDLHPPAR